MMVNKLALLLNDASRQLEIIGRRGEKARLRALEFSSHSMDKSLDLIAYGTDYSPQFAELKPYNLLSSQFLRNWTKATTLEAVKYISTH